jgi:hypothetical protein
MSAASSGAAPTRGGMRKNRRLCTDRHCDRRKSEIRGSFGSCINMQPRVSRWTEQHRARELVGNPKQNLSCFCD